MLMFQRQLHMIDPFPLNGGFRGDQPTNVKFDIDKLKGVTVGGGTEFEIAKNLHFKLEYRYTDLFCTRDFRFEGSNLSHTNWFFNLNRQSMLSLQTASRTTASAFMA